MAVGDAACVFDPLASSGVTKAFCDARVAADSIIAFLANGATESIDEYGRSSLQHFERYMRHRKAQYLLEPRWVSAPFWSRRLH